MPRRNNKVYPVTEIIPAEKLKILLADNEEFLVVKRTEKGVLISGLRRYLEGFKGEQRDADPFAP